MDRSGRRVVRELGDGIGDLTPSHCAIVIAVGRQFVGARGAPLKCLLAVALDHQIGAPDIDLGYHAVRLQLAIYEDLMTMSATTWSWRRYGIDVGQ
jgi:hypothetical protein